MLLLFTPVSLSLRPFLPAFLLALLHLFMLVLVILLLLHVSCVHVFVVVVNCCLSRVCYSVSLCGR